MLCPRKCWRSAPNLAATIDQQARHQYLHGNLRAGLSFITDYALFEAVSAIENPLRGLVESHGVAKHTEQQML
jgi:hypothetical protein